MQEGHDLGIESSAKSAERCAIAIYYRILREINVVVPVCEWLMGKDMAICKGFLFGGSGASQAGEEGREGHVGFHWLGNESVSWLA